MGLWGVSHGTPQIERPDITDMFFACHVLSFMFERDSDLGVF